MRKIELIMSYILEKILILLSIFLIFFVFANVVFRFVLRIPFSSANEWASYSFIWWVMLGAALAVKEEKHLSVDFLRNILSPKIQGIIKKIIYVANIIYGSVITYYSITMLPTLMRQRTPFSQIPIAFIYVVFPIAGIAFIIFSVMQLINFKGKSVN